MDVLTALRVSLNRVPSRTYSEIFSLIAETYLISANLADILMLKLEYLVRNKYNRLRSATQALGLFMEIYLVIALLLPILLVLIVITLSPLGPIYLGPITLSPTLALLIMTLIYSPVMGVRNVHTNRLHDILNRITKQPLPDRTLYKLNKIKIILY
ncbi:type II secretion system F family protein [Vulcanisaeta distributa]|uniref:type II secretion system F family protein n=1 Tax=Vulcanisaeta distributa TaxID=164451 RepID=UPI0006D0387C|nr:type II secretion system F family protein [Vulcanisaeta distributa]